MTPVGRVRIENALRDREGVVALVLYLAAGYPSRHAFADLLAWATAAADVVEIGVPFTDPMADGVTIQRASRQALENGARLPWILESLAQRPQSSRAPVILMSYLNPLLSYGVEALAGDANAARVSGFIVPDLPLEESASFRRACQPTGLALVQLTSPVTPPDRLRKLGEQSDGFIYAVTTLGTTGGSTEVSPEVCRYLDQVRRISPRPVCAGFGIHTRSQVEALAPHCDGVVVGSALVRAIEANRDLTELVESLRVKQKELRP